MADPTTVERINSMLIPTFEDIAKLWHEQEQAEKAAHAQEMKQLALDIAAELFRLQQEK